MNKARSAFAKRHFNSILSVPSCWGVPLRSGPNSEINPPGIAETSQRGQLMLRARICKLVFVAALCAILSGCSHANSSNLFAGRWYGHGRSIVIRPDGRFTMTARTYVFCSEAPPPCDAISGNHIYDGANARGELSSVSGDIAKGKVARTTDVQIFPYGRVTLRFHPATDTVSFAAGTFCGPRAPAGYCGA
jgi:hypothetical protein